MKMGTRRVERLGRSLLGACAAVWLLAGCGERDRTQTEQAGATETTTTTTEAPQADVAFLVAACEASGLPAARCSCAGDRARTALGAELVAKMKEAPADDDPALESYYSGQDVRRIMAWVDDASSECGLEEYE